MTNRQHIQILNTTTVIPAVSVLLAMSGMAGCTAPQARPATQHGASGASYREIPDKERGMRPAGRLGFDHTLQVRRSKTGIPHELHDGDSVMTDDRIGVSIMTSEDAHLYLAFCAHQELSVYPTQGGFRTRAGELMLAPTRAELVLDSDPGPEVLYVIVSRRELSLADPKLAQALAAQRPRNTPTDCGTNLDAKLAKTPGDAGATRPPAPGSTNVLHGALRAKKPMPSTRQAGSGAPPSAPPHNAPPDPDFERSPGDIVWYRVDGVTGPADVVATDEDGIAVVRHAFTHVASASSP